jgi:hypothetical protein
MVTPQPFVNRAGAAAIKSRDRTAHRSYKTYRTYGIPESFGALYAS